jgi:hypothetical protein
MLLNKNRNAANALTMRRIQRSKCRRSKLKIAKVISKRDLDISGPSGYGLLSARRVSDHGKTYQVDFYCSTSVVDKLVNNAGYPNIVADYERSFAELRKMPCDVFLAPHAGFFNLEEKRRQLDPGKLDAFQGTSVTGRLGQNQNMLPRQRFNHLT